MDSERQLRSDVVRALDEVLPAAPWLESRVAEDFRNRRRGGLPRRVLPLPRPANQLAVVAILVVAAIVAGVLATGALRHSQTAPGGITPLRIYWANSGFGTGTTIGRANVDGTGVTQRFITGARAPWDVAVDGSHVYWANNANGTIGRANLDGTAVNQSFIIGAQAPSGVAVDGAHIYWSNAGTNGCEPQATCAGSTIGRANLDGTGVNQAFITGAKAPLHIAIDSNYLYWANHGGTSVGRANLDGTGVNQNFVETSGNPAGLAVDGSYIYWNTDSGFGRANLDGSSVNPSFIMVGYSAGIALDSTHIFWGHFDTGIDVIGRANLDGTGVNESFISGGNAPTGVAVAPAASGNQDLLAELQARRLDHPPASPPSGPTVQVQTGLLASGTHEYLGVDQQGFNVRFTVPAGWTWNGRYLSKGSAAIYFFGGPVQVYADPCRWATAPSKPTTGFSASRIVAALAAQRLRSATTPISLPINVLAGLPGEAVQLTVPGDLNLSTCDEGQFRSWGPESVLRSHQGPGQRDLVWAADVPGSGIWNPGVGIEPPGGLIVDAAYFPDTPAEIRSEIVAILGSVTAGHWG